MNPALLDLLACPDCRCDELIVSVADDEQEGPSAERVEQGIIVCRGCSMKYPIRAGIPRMLPSSLRQASSDGNGERIDGTLRTARGYDAQHLRELSNRPSNDVKPVGAAANIALSAHYFHEFLMLGPNGLRSLKGRVVLDAGCGGGRFMAAAALGASNVVGLDLSEGGLLHAQALVGKRDHVHLVQGDISHPPFRSGAFDVIYSIGVLHHLANPAEGFHALKQLLAPGGRLWVWVYGLEGMSWVYRLSHLRSFRRFTRSWSLPAKFRLCRWLALAFRLAYLAPLTLAQRILPVAIVRHLPYSEWTAFSLDDIAYSFFDRLQPPYTHYLRKTQLQQWLRGLEGIAIESPSKRGWTAKGRKAGAEAVADEVSRQVAGELG